MHVSVRWARTIFVIVSCPSLDTSESLGVLFFVVVIFGVPTFCLCPVSSLVRQTFTFSMLGLVFSALFGVFVDYAAVASSKLVPSSDALPISCF